jgi:hypothetical protein
MRHSERLSISLAFFWHRLVNFYGQDQWKVMSGLSLTLGLRYDFDVFPSAADVGVAGGFHPTNYGNVQPRIGLAYAINGGKQVLRAGFGIFTGPTDYSDLLVSWQGTSAFIPMSNPFVDDFNKPNCVVGLKRTIRGRWRLGPHSCITVFSNFATSGLYPTPANQLDCSVLAE